MLKGKFILTAFIFVFFSGCSLKYDNSSKAEDVNPEFVFNATTIYRYEKKKPSATIQAESIEQYKNSDVSYAKDIKFETYDKEDQKDTEGKCGFLAADTGNNTFDLYDKIEVFSRSQNAHFYADALRWDGKNEQLTSARNDTVKIIKDSNVIIGSGFSADGVSGEYQFTGTVSGNLAAEDKQVQEDNLAEDFPETSEAEKEDRL